MFYLSQKWSINYLLPSTCFFPSLSKEFNQDKLVNATDLHKIFTSQSLLQSTNHKPHFAFPNIKPDEQEKSPDGWSVLPRLAGGARLLALLVRLVKTRLCPRGVLDGRRVICWAWVQTQPRVEARMERLAWSQRHGLLNHRWRHVGAVCERLWGHRVWLWRIGGSWIGESWRQQWWLACHF